MCVVGPLDVVSGERRLDENARRNLFAWSCDGLAIEKFALACDRRNDLAAVEATVLNKNARGFADRRLRRRLRRCRARWFRAVRDSRAAFGGGVEFDTSAREEIEIGMISR